MVETWAMFGATSVGLVVIIGLFVRIEHRMTKVETIVTILGKRREYANRTWTPI